MGIPVIQPSGNSSPATTRPATPPADPDTDGERPFVDEPEPEQGAAARSGMDFPIVRPAGNLPLTTAAPSASTPAADTNREMPHAEPKPEQVDATAATEAPAAGVVRVVGQEELLQLLAVGEWE
eukprot:TRINITY_DN9331_c0_g1_i1.p1 TRINITY_DN9331_c0_g1~~TRINITY_DN9331_c0_g1_i1.p1  ORF type:complete len:124 (-),score=28.27 TRINITY_DN9331_c0_g1_i1:259-630(-)